MVDETKAQAQAAAEAPAKVAEAVAKTAEKVVAETKATAKRERAKTVRRARRAATAETKKAPREAAKRRAKPVRRNVRAAAAKVAGATQQRISEMNTNAYNFFAGFDGVPGFAPFNSLFADAGERGQQAVRRSQEVAEQLVDLTRANVEAIVESSRLAVEGARSISQDAVARGRQGVEQAADAIRGLAEAKSPTEFVQLQSELARSSFDRLVAESSRLTESMVKLAGEAIQPLSNRATANAERLNDLVA